MRTANRLPCDSRAIACGGCASLRSATGNATFRPGGALEFHHPVRLPRLAFIEGVSLLPMRRGRRDVGPDQPRGQRQVVERRGAIELADAVLPVTLHGWIEVVSRFAAVEPPDRPLLFLRIVRAQ